MVQKFFVFTLSSAFIFVSLWAGASELKCEDVVQSTSSEKTAIVESLNLKLEPVLSALRGEKAGWQAYLWIKETKSNLISSKLSTVDFHDIKPLVEKAFTEFQKVDNKHYFVDRNYEFFRGLQEINSLLNWDLFPKSYLALAASNDVLINDAIQTVKATEKRIRRLYHQTRLKNTIEMVQVIENQSPTVKKLLELVSDQLIVTIRRPESARFWIPVAGFQNFRVTGSSKGGAIDYEKRNRLEALLTGQTVGEFTAKSVRYMPNYGEVIPDFTKTGLMTGRHTNRYGSDVWIFKQSVAETRTTWSPTDSYRQAGSQASSLGHIRNWNESFLPWSHRELMIPFLATWAESGRFVPAKNTIEDLPGIGGPAEEFMEAQIWGPLSLDDVEAFVFEESPPSAEFLNELKSRGIKVYDNRFGHKTPYGH